MIFFIAPNTKIMGHVPSYGKQTLVSALNGLISHVSPLSRHIIQLIQLFDRHDLQDPSVFILLYVDEFNLLMHYLIHHQLH